MLLDKLSFYDFDGFDCVSGEEIVIELKNILGKTRYCDVVYYGFNRVVKKEYTVRQNILLKTLLSLFSSWKESIYIVKYDEQWINNKRISKKLNKLFFENEIGEETAAIQTDDMNLVELTCKSIFKGNTCAFFALPDAGIIITPTDHMDIFIAGRENVEDIVRKILKNSVKNNNYLKLKKCVS